MLCVLCGFLFASLRLMGLKMALGASDFFCRAAQNKKKKASFPANGPVFLLLSPVICQ